LAGPLRPANSFYVLRDDPGRDASHDTARWDETVHDCASGNYHVFPNARSWKDHGPSTNPASCPYGHWLLAWPLCTNRLVDVPIAVVLICDVHVGSCHHVVPNLYAQMSNDVRAPANHATIPYPHDGTAEHLLTRKHPGRHRDVGPNERVTANVDPFLPKGVPRREGETAPHPEAVKTPTSGVVRPDRPENAKPLPSLVDKSRDQAASTHGLRLAWWLSMTLETGPVHQVRSKRRLRIAVALTLLALLAALTTACGSSQRSPSSLPARVPKVSPLEEVQEMAAKTLAAKRAQILLDLSVTGLPASSPLGTSLSMHAVGLVNFPYDAAKLDTTFSGKIASLIGSKVILTLVNHEVFVPATGVIAKVAKGKSYVSVTASALAGAITGALSGAGPIVSALLSRPSLLLELYETKSLMVNKVGTALLDGSKTVEYHVSLPVAKAAASGGPAELIYKELEKAGVESLGSTVWIGKRAGFLRKVTTTLGSPPGPTGSLVVELDGFGTPADVPVPPASQVTQLSI
jgi:hypothetical protein